MPDSLPSRHVERCTMTELEARQSPAAADLRSLPEWDLSDLYPSPTSPALQEDLEQMERDAKAFGARWQGRLSEIDGAELATAIADFEELQERLGRVASYAHLVYAGDMSDAENGRFYQSMQERVTQLSSLRSEERRVGKERRRRRWTA